MFVRSSIIFTTSLCNTCGTVEKSIKLTLFFLSKHVKNKLFYVNINCQFSVKRKTYYRILEKGVNIMSNLRGAHA